MAPGDYALMAFTFDPGQECDFCVSIFCKDDLDVSSTEGTGLMPAREPAPPPTVDGNAVLLAPAGGSAANRVVGGDDFDDNDDGSGPSMVGASFCWLVAVSDLCG